MLDVEELLRTFNWFIEHLEEVALPAEKQIQEIKVCAVADEIALDYCETGMLCAKQLYENGWLTLESYNLAKELYERFDRMSDNKELWDNNALSSAIEWEECRITAKKLLEVLSK